MNKAQIIIIAIIAIIIIAGICFKLGIIVGKKSLEGKLSEAQEIIDAYALPVPEEIFSVDGEIKEIKDNIISLEVALFVALPLPNKEPEKEIIRVVVGEETKIVKTEIPEYPLEEFKQTEISLTDLRPGNWIYATSEENIKDKKEFTAQSIELTEQLIGEIAPLPEEGAPPLPE